MTSLEKARKALEEAEALLITAGAGMGVDSGLPDFRGNEGFWKAYPPLAARGIAFYDIANPGWFEEDPALAWGFYGHRLNLYRRTVPHEGFGLLLEAAMRMKDGYFVVTSNVDGHFQKAGFSQDKIVEIHGSIHHLQCRTACKAGLWPADGFEIEIDPESYEATSKLPSCPACGEMVRPNIMMFGDYWWLGKREKEQRATYDRWLESVRGKRLVVVECGAGTAIPSIRMLSSRLAESPGVTLIRINPRDCDVEPGEISLPVGALEGIRQLLVP